MFEIMMSELYNLKIIFYQLADFDAGTLRRVSFKFIFLFIFWKDALDFSF